MATNILILVERQVKEFRQKYDVEYNKTRKSKEGGGVTNGRAH